MKLPIIVLKLSKVVIKLPINAVKLPTVVVKLSTDVVKLPTCVITYAKLPKVTVKLHSVIEKLTTTVKVALFSVTMMSESNASNVKPTKWGTTMVVMVVGCADT
jgi:hypothetical protein